MSDLPAPEITPPGPDVAPAGSPMPDDGRTHD